nr:ABC transporter permease [Arthrobacter roseus]
MRLAGRDARKHRGRSALILSLIALPVAAMTVIVLLLASTQATVQERIDAELGTAQAYLTPLNTDGSGLIQYPTMTSPISTPGDPDPHFVAKSPAAVVPPGYTTVEESNTQILIPMQRPETRASVVGSDLFNPGFESRFSLIEGTKTPGADGIYVSPSLQGRLGIDVGDRLTLEAGDYRVAGIIWEGATKNMADTIYVSSANHPVVTEAEYELKRLYLFGDEPLTWPQIQELNAQGVAALSRAVLLDPPPAPELLGPDEYGERQMITFILGVSMVGILVLAEVGLLAGAAFAVGAKNQRRMLALLAAAGGEKSTVRSVVTASGVVLGALGAIAGVVVGTGVAAAVVYWSLSQHSMMFAGFHLLVWPLIIFALLGFTASVIAAAVPGFAMAKQDAFNSLKSAQTTSKPQSRIPVVGLVLIGLSLLLGGAGVAVILGLDDPEQYGPKGVVFVPLMAGGTLLFLLGLLLCTGRIVDLMGRFAGMLPLAPRMAVRDASRNRGRSVPSIAAVLAATALASIVMVGSATFAQEEAGKRHVSLNDQQGAVSLRTPNSDSEAWQTTDPEVTISAVESVVGPVESSTIISGVHDTCSPAQGCVHREFISPSENTCRAKAERNAGDIWSCTDPDTNVGSAFPLLTVGGAEALKSMLGHEPTPEVLQALKDGKMVVLDQSWIKDGHVRIRSRTYEFEGGEVRNEAYLELPAVAAEPAARLSVGGVISPQTAEEQGFTVKELSLIMDLPSHPTKAEVEAINVKLESGSWFTTQYPGPPTEKILWAIAGIACLVALTAASITAGLALADGRADHMTLAGVGAAPRLRKAIAAWQSGLTAVVGVGLGLAAGLLPAVALFGSAREYVLVVPWPQLGVLLILVPVVGAASAWLFTRTRIPMARRALLQ